MPTLKELLVLSPWTENLTPAQRQRLETDTTERHIPKGGYVCRKGEPVEHWIGVIAGLVKMVNVSLEGKETTFTGGTTGGWFGEGSLLKSEPRRYNVVALRDSRIAFMPRATFMWLLDNNIAFNRFLLTQLNERLGQFIGLVEYDRLLPPDARVARCLASLFNAHLSPGIGPTLNISQEEISHLAGLSRQRVNYSLKLLEMAALVRTEYGGITVLDVDGLRQFDG
jgi:CRP/FNR family cyclic AMP-dependent transcriptional regulator